MKNFIHAEETARFAEINKSIIFKYILPNINMAHESITSMAQIPDRSFAVTDLTCPRLHKLFNTAWTTLEMDDKRKCNLFCSMDYDRNITTSGTDEDSLMVVSSTCLDDFSDEQLLALLGREIGHLKLNHLKYLTAFNLFDSLTSYLPSFLSAGASAAKGLLFELLLATQYSADRAGAIVAGDIFPVIKNNLMISGIENAEDCINYEDYITTDIQQDFNNFDRLTKALMTNALRELPMPFVILRIQELLKWSSSEDCRINFPEIYRPNSSGIKSNVKLIKEFCQSLVKGQRINLSSQSEKFSFSFEYDSIGNEIEIDIFVFLTGNEGKVSSTENLVFCNNLRHNSGAVTIDGKKNIAVNLALIPKNISKISLTAAIYSADKRHQNFGMVNNLNLKFADEEGNLTAFSPKDLNTETAIVLGEIYRNKNEWKFKAIGEGFSGGLKTLGENFGIKGLVEKS